MARRRYQRPNVHRTQGKRPQWYFRARIDVLTGPGQRERRERTYYLGFCDECGKREAERQRDAVLGEVINQPQVLLQSQVKFGDVVAAYLRDHLPTLRAVTQGTYRNRIEKWILPTLGTRRVCDLTPLVVQQWVNGMDASVTTRKSAVAHFRLIWSRAIVWGYTQTVDPSRGVSCGTQRAALGKSIPTLEQIRRMREILAASEPVVGDMLDVAIGTGLRVSEIRGLQVGDLDFTGDALTVRRRMDRLNGVDVPKSVKSRRRVPIGELRDMLRRYTAGRPADAYVFELPHGYEWLQVRLRDAAAKAGYVARGFGWHDMRRALNTWLRKSGARPEDARDQLGHATIAQNDVYLISESEDWARRAELVRAVQARVIGRVQ